MKSLIFLFLITFSHLSYSQDIQVQSFVGNTGIQFSNIIQREITKDKKLNYFGFNNISMEYNSIDSIDLDLLNLVNYNLLKGIVVVGGMSVNKKDIIPQLGIGYTMDRERFNLNVFPMLNYSLKQRDYGAGIYTLIEFTPYLKKKWDYYSMLILDSDFSFSDHIESKQYVRLGVQYDKKLQFGLGLDLEQKTSNFDLSSNYGLFLGYTF